MKEKNKTTPVSETATEEKVISTKRYIIEYIEKESGITLRRINEGFDGIFLLGLLEQIQLEILKQMSDSIKPDIIKREVIVHCQHNYVKSAIAKGMLVCSKCNKYKPEGM